MLSLPTKTCESCGWKFFTTTSIPCPRCQPKAKREPVVLNPIPRDQWPVWATIAATRKHEGDVGVGDTIQKVAAKFGGEQFKAWAAELGIPCGCSTRQKRFNALYPYEDQQE